MIDAYAQLHTKSRESYLLDLILDGIEAEGHAKMDLRRIPEIEARGGPKMNPGCVLRTYSAAIEPPGRLYNAKQIAARLGVSRYMVYWIKKANRILAERNQEPLIFHGRLTTLERITEWMDRHRDWTKDYEVRKPEPPEVGDHVVSETRPPTVRDGRHPIVRLAQDPDSADGDTNIHGADRVARACRLSEPHYVEILSAMEKSRDNPQRLGAWMTVNKIRRWLRAHPEFTVRYDNASKAASTPDNVRPDVDSSQIIPTSAPIAPPCA